MRTRVYFKDFTEHEKAWVTSEETLKKQVALSLVERAAEFNKHFKTNKANRYFIRKIYRTTGVKRKLIQHTKLSKEMNMFRISSCFLQS